MRKSIAQFADAGIAGLSTIVGGGGKCKTTKKSKKSQKCGSKKSKKTGSKGSGSCPPSPCW